MEFISPNNQAGGPPSARPGDSNQSPLPNSSMGLTPKEPTEKHYKNILSTAGLFASALLIAVLLNSFVIQSYQVDGQSMESTLQNNDRLIVNKIPRTISRIDGHQYLPHRGDVIIFNEEGIPGFVGQKQLIKRVIALPGEHIVVTGTKTTVYNSAHPEGFNPDTSLGYHPNIGVSCSDADITLKSNQIFVMGDNRGNSEDSRCFGPINSNQIVAKLVLRILPFNKTQKF